MQLAHLRRGALILGFTAALATGPIALATTASAATPHHGPAAVAAPGNHEIAPGLSGKALDNAVQARLFGKPGAPPPPTSPNCLASDSSYCWVSPGAGNQVYIADGGAAGMAVVNCTNYGNFTWCEFQNGNGHCFYDGYGGGSEPMLEGSNACTGGLSQSPKQYDMLDPVANGYRLVPAVDADCSTGQCTWYDYWGVYSNANGKPVWGIPVGTNAWVTWTR